jgi:signal transduction histidine kinase
MRIGRLDLAVGIAAAALGGWTASLQSGGALAVAGGVLLGASLGALRGAPMLGFAFAVAGTTLAGIDGSIADGPMALLLISSFGIGLYAGRVAGVVAVVALFAADLTHAFSADDWVPTVMFPAVFWGAGRAMRAHEVVARRLKERAAELAEEREAYAQLSVRYERARIAAELHDIVAHAISVMVVQASAGQRLAAVDPELTTQTFHTIADAARQAEDDMGRLVALLGDEPDTAPAPDLALVRELVARAAGSGLDVTLRLEGGVDDVPAATAAAAYRVVQESLTNALRYAAGAPVAVTLRGDEEAIDVEVRNGAADSEPQLRGAGTGNGLAGLRERIDACGGSVEAGPQPGGGWRVAARIPRRVPAFSPTA